MNNEYFCNLFCVFILLIFEFSSVSCASLSLQYNDYGQDQDAITSSAGINFKAQVLAHPCDTPVTCL
jgi:hypothetical protein